MVFECCVVDRVQIQVGLGWAGLGWAGLGWTRLDRQDWNTGVVLCWRCFAIRCVLVWGWSALCGSSLRDRSIGTSYRSRCAS